MKKIALLAMTVILAGTLWGCAGGEEADKTAPTISGVSASDITQTSATIIWITDETATSQVEYGPTTSYGSTSPLDNELVTSHSVSLSELTAGSTYHYRVKSKDAAKNEKTSGDYAFTTASAGDTTAPVVSGVSASDVTTSTATISWTTDEPATSQVEYGPTTSYGSITPLDSTLVTTHSVSLTGLTAGTTYHYTVKSKDAAANEVTSEDYTFTTESLPIAFIYSTDATGANSYRSLLEGDGYSVTPILMGDVATTDFSVYGLIIVGPDTGSGYEWGNAASVVAIQDSGKPIIGLHDGGASLFQELGLSINWGHSGSPGSGETGLYVVDPSHVIFNSPHSISVPGDQIIQLYSSLSPLIHEYAPHLSPEATLLGRHPSPTQIIYYPLVQEGQNILWGFVASPESMTQVGKDLFLNVVDFMLTAAFPPDTTPPVISEVSASGITTSTATITWTTDVGATSQVEYGLTISYGSTTTLNEDLVYSHSVTLSDLDPDTTYHYRVKSKDASENEAVSEDYTFATTAPAEPIIAFEPASFSFTAIEGGDNPSSETLEVWNSGIGTLNWSVGEYANWLTLSPPNGDSTGEHDFILVSPDISAMSDGIYSTTITISASGAANSPQTASVSLIISPELSGISMFSMDYSDTEGNTMTMDYWKKGEKSRTDWHWTTPGEEETLIFISDGEFDWVYYPAENMAFKFNLESGMNPGTEYEEGVAQFYFGYMTESTILEYLQVECERDPACVSVEMSGHENVSGKDCAIFTGLVTDGSTISVWISLSDGVIMKSEQYDASTGFTSTVEMTDIDLSPTISDDIFDVDQVFALGTEIVDMTGS